MLRDLNWLNVENMYKFEVVCNIRRTLWHRTAYYTFFLLVSRRQHDHITRRQDLGMVWLKNNQFGRNSYVMCGVRIYNDLGLNPRWFSDYEQFKHEVRIEILGRYDNGNL